MAGDLQGPEKLLWATFGNLSSGSSYQLAPGFLPSPNAHLAYAKSQPASIIYIQSLMAKLAE